MIENIPAWMWFVGMLVLLMLCAGCTEQPTPLPDSLCVATRPIYFREGAINALQDWREERVAVAAHNAKWEQICGPFME